MFVFVDSVRENERFRNTLFVFFHVELVGKYMLLFQKKQIIMDVLISK